MKSLMCSSLGKARGGYPWAHDTTHQAHVLAVAKHPGFQGKSKPVPHTPQLAEAVLGNLQ